jgi:hypothetical protein
VAERERKRGARRARASLQKSADALRLGCLFIRIGWKPGELRAPLYFVHAVRPRDKITTKL